RDDTSDVDTHTLHFFFRFGPDVNKDIFKAGCFFFTRFTHVDGGPSEHTLHDALIGVDIHAFTRRDLVVRTPVAAHIDVPVLGNIVDKPRDLIGMALNHYLVGAFRIDHPYHGAIHVGDVIVDIGPDIVQPDLLT